MRAGQIDRLEWLTQRLETAGVGYSPHPPRVDGYRDPGWYWMYLPRGEYDKGMNAVLHEVQGLFTLQRDWAQRLNFSRFVRHDSHHIDLWLCCTRDCSRPPAEPFARMVWEYATQRRPGPPSLRA